MGSHTPSSEEAGLNWLFPFFSQDEFSHLVQQWNIQRSEALKRALEKILYPQMEKELRSKLIAEAKEGIIKVGGRARRHHQGRG